LEDCFLAITSIERWKSSPELIKKVRLGTEKHPCLGGNPVLLELNKTALLGRGDEQRPRAKPVKSSTKHAASILGSVVPGLKIEDAAMDLHTEALEAV